MFKKKIFSFVLGLALVSLCLCSSGLMAGCSSSNKGVATTKPNPPEDTAKTEPPVTTIVADTSWIKGSKWVDTALNAYNNAFLVTQGSSVYYKASLKATEKDYFWQQALDIQMVEDVYRVHRLDDYKTLIENLLNTFLAQNAGKAGLTDWDWNDYNDDLLWAGLAFVRGYQITGKKLFLNQAKYAFDRLYKRGWDDELGGGIWWDVKKSNKSGLSNNPAVILACYLYQFTGDDSYLTKAKDIYSWIIKTLYDKETGAVHENIAPSGQLSGGINVYNIGAFVGGANFLSDLTHDPTYLSDAERSINYVVQHNVIMARNQRDGTWQSEFARALGEFLRSNPSYWSTYYSWMKKNADAAWGARRTDLNLIWNDWMNPTALDDTKANECVSAIVMLAITPDSQPQP